MAESQEPSPPRRPSQYNSYLKYSGLAIQLLASIAICGWIGHKLDQWLNFKYPIFMLILGFLGFGAIMFQIYKSINQEQS
jgi:F0F1-type ATP synthase assembly protein I